MRSPELLVRYAVRSTFPEVVASQHFREFDIASQNISRCETINMIRKGQIQSMEQRDILGQIKFILPSLEQLSKRQNNQELILTFYFYP